MLHPNRDKDFSLIYLQSTGKNVEKSQRKSKTRQDQAKTIEAIKSIKGLVFDMREKDKI